MSDAIHLNLTFEAPRWLWLLVVCIPAAWLVAARRPVGTRRGSPWLAVLLRTAVLAGLIMAAARPVRLTDDAAISAVAVVDVSASVSDAGLEQERALIRDLAREGTPPHEVRLVTFAAAPAEVKIAGGLGGGSADMRAALLAAADELKRPAATQALGTDIGRALAFAAAVADPARTRRLLLLSDGRATGGDALAQATRLGGLGIRVDYVQLGRDAGVSAGQADVAIDGIEAPSAPVSPHATFPLRVHLVANRPTRVRLRLTRDGRAMDPRDVTRILEIAGGETEVTWPARIEEVGRPALFAAEVQPVAGRDVHPENNSALLAIATKAAPRVLLLATEAREAAPLAGALRAQSMDVEVAVGTAAISGAVQAGNLAHADLVVLCDVPRGAATGAVREGKVLAALEAYVRDGGGLLVTGGPQSFGPGGWGGSRLEALLPVRLDTPRQRDEPTLALALVIDRSGSMSGAKMDLTKQAARGTAAMLPVDDQIAVIAFDSKASTIVPLQRAANRLRIATDIGRIQPTGGTNILAGLREAVDQLASARAKKKHAILLSDGQSATEGISELVDAAVGSHITISTIGVGDGVDDALMQLIAHQGGGRYYRTRDPASIPRIFTRETSEVATSSGIVERPTAALPRKRAAVIEGIPWVAAPRLGGYVRTHPRGQAELLLGTDAGDPLLTRWSVGLGQVVAWTSDVGVRWADAWTRWPPFAQLWGQIARGAMRARAARQFPLSARVQAGMVEVAVEAAGDASDVVLSGLEGAVDVVQVAADGKVMEDLPRRVALAETSPGRYVAQFPVGDEVTTGRKVGALLLRGVLARQGRQVAEAMGQLSVPLVPELRPTPTAGSSTNGGGDGGGGGGGGRTLLEAIAAATGGHALTTSADLFKGGERRGRSRPLHAPLLGAVALLFVADVAVRRLAQRWPAPPPGAVSEFRGTSPPP